MSALTLAIVYAVLAAFPTAMHIALSLGAPLGRFTVGGRFPGRLPSVWRGLALVQVGVLLGMACAVLDRGGVVVLGWPALAFWLALAMTGFTAIANIITPSRPERMLWSPVTLAMSATAIGVAVQGAAL